MTQRLFDNLDRLALLPVEIANCAFQLLSEIEHSGEQTTADETVKLIEAVLAHLGRLWIAEYIHAGVGDQRLTRDLFDLLGRNLFVGTFVGLSRRIRQQFVENGLDTLVTGLAAQDFGELDDPDHPIARLVAYRNSFSHGSMAAVVEDIRAHRHLVEDVLTKLPALVDQPMRFAAEPGGPMLTATADWSPAPDDTGKDEPPLQPFIVGADGERRLCLYPLLYVTHAAEGRVLRHGTAKDRQHPISALFKREQLRIWYERYQSERQGHLDFTDAIAARAPRLVDEAALAALAEVLADDEVSLVVVEAHPGCGKTGMLTALTEIVPADRYADISVFVIEPGDISQSGATLARFLLRRAEAALDLDDGHFGGPTAELLRQLTSAGDALDQAGKRLLVGIENLHVGYAPYRQEPLSVAEVYRSLAEGPIHVVATLYPGSAAGPLIFDHKVVLPIPAPDRIAMDRLAEEVEQLCDPAVPMRRRVLRQLLRQNEPLSLFALCDALEEDGATVFEPAVERALWDLRPVLRVERSGAEKLWAPFTPNLAQVALLAE